MKILRLLAEDIKKIKAIDITPPEDEAVVVIGGMNDQGKTSALDTIQLALDPESLKRAVSRPLREGAEHGQIVLDLGEGHTVQVEVSRTYTGNGASYLNVWADGEKVKSSPQAFLDRLIGALAFDPQAFARMEPARQRVTLLDLVRLDIDLPALEAEYATTFEARTSLNRDLKQHQGALVQMPAPAPDLPGTEVSAADLLAAIQTARTRGFATPRSGSSSTRSGARRPPPRRGSRIATGRSASWTPGSRRSAPRATRSRRPTPPSSPADGSWRPRSPASSIPISTPGARSSARSRSATKRSGAASSIAPRRPRWAGCSGRARG
jgi:hypothetical protein